MKYFDKDWATKFATSEKGSYYNQEVLKDYNASTATKRSSVSAKWRPLNLLRETIICVLLLIFAQLLLKKRR